MARSFASVSATEPESHFVHDLSKRHYEVFRRGGKLLQRRYELDARQQPMNVFEMEATHVIGSGNHARTFLHRTESGELIELPLTWYSQESRWAMSPGFDQSRPPDFTRIADESCLFCHNGYPTAGGALAEGIDCQRCHGPGLHHVQLATEGKADKSKVRAAIVNPARLSPELQMDVCMQCHLETTSAEFPAIIRRLDRAPFSYVAGEPLGAYMVHFDHGSAADARERFEIAGQAYRLRQAACFRNSQGRLTCTVCHDPHAVERGATSIPYYRAKCVGCHPSVAAAGHPELASADCVSCHMPRRRTQDAVHVIMTDHLIQSGPASGDLTKPLTESASTYRGPLAVYYPQLSSRERDLYLGVAMIAGGVERPGGIAMLERGLDAHSPAKAFAVLGEGYLAQGDPHAAVRAFRQAVERSPDVAKIHYNLAQALEAAGDMTGSRSEYERALHIQSVFPEAEYALGNLLVKSGEAALGSTHYQAAIRARPVYFEARNNLGNVYANQDRLPEARAQLEEALRINPAFAEAHTNLARVLAMQHEIPEAIAHARRAVDLNPQYVRGHYNLGQLLQSTDALEAAIGEYRRAVALSPEFVEAHLSLGAALGDSGRLDLAIAEFREVLRLRPGHAEAEKNLRMALALKTKEK
jgi:tetratricopeptide (TPR) repeat protein